MYNKHWERLEICFQEKCDNLFSWFINNVSCFKIAFLSGILIHLGVFVYNLGNGDTIKWSIYQYNFSWERAQGRWLLEWISWFRNDKVIPIFITLLSILYISLAIMFIVDILNIKNRIAVGIFSVLFITSPFLSRYLYLYYTSDAYCLGILLISLATWLLIKKNKRIYVFFSALLIMCSLAIYQATLNLIVTLCCIDIFLRALRNKDAVINQMKCAGTYLFCGIMGVAMYLVSLKLTFAIRGGELANYKGMNEMGHYSLSIIWGMLKNYFRHINLMYFTTNQNVSYSYFYSRGLNGKIINSCLIIMLLIVIVYLIRKNCLLQNRKCFIWFLFSSLLLCLGWSVIIFTSTTFATENAPINALISPQLGLLYGFSFTICEEINRTKGIFILKNGIVILVSMMCFNFILVTNETYYGNQLAWNQAVTLTGRIVDRMEQTEGWYAGMPVAIYGGFTGEISENYQNVNSVIRDASMPFMWEDQTQLGWVKFLNMYYGIKYNGCDGNFYDKFGSSSDFAEMPIFPAKGSVKVKDGVMIVKLGSKN